MTLVKQLLQGDKIDMGMTPVLRVGAKGDQRIGKRPGGHVNGRFV